MSARFWAIVILFFGIIPPVAAQQRGGPAGAFDFYVLALSWSAGFCAVEGDAKGRDQCAAGRGLGFVVHGLWPQNEQGYPTDCGPQGRMPTSMAMDVARDVFPEQGLARYQWRKHGTCAGTSPAQYFADAKAARARVVIPKAFQGAAGENRVKPGDVVRAFVESNAGLRADMMALSCRRGVLDEVRICLARDLRGFRTCAEVSRNSCRSTEITVPAVR